MKINPKLIYPNKLCKADDFTKSEVAVNTNQPISGILGRCTMVMWPSLSLKNFVYAEKYLFIHLLYHSNLISRCFGLKPVHWGLWQHRLLLDRLDS